MIASRLRACRARRGASAAAVLALVLGAAANPGFSEEWSMPTIALPKDARHPVVAATPQELGNLLAAWKAAGPAHDVVAGVVRRADKALGAPLDFPPRGGQHNQWYQCQDCQVGLRTVDPTHHQCPKCKKVYTGEPYDDVIIEHVHEANLANARAAAWAYAVTGDAKYAAFTAKVLRGYAQRYRTYPFHDSSRRQGEKASRSGGHLFEQTLNEACSMTHDIAPAYDLIHDALSEADRDAIRQGLLMPMLESIDRNKAGKSNWQTWHNAAFLWGGGALGQADWVRKAVEDPKNGFLYQMGASVSPEGMWYENSWGYHFYTLSAMVQIVEGARRLGIDLWGHPTLRKMFTLPVRYAMADGSLPRFGDDVQTTVGHALRYAEPAYHATSDPALAALLPGGTTWDTVLFGRQPSARPAPAVSGSEVFPGAGHAILRTGGEAGLTAAMTFGPYGGFHGHLDKLSFVFFGHDRELAVDPGRARSQAYRLPIHRDWYKATLGHNTVLVDGASQQPAAGRLDRFAAADAWAAAVATCTEAYPGVRHTRMLCLGPTYLLVVDDLAAEKPRRFDWVYHHRGSQVRSDAAVAAGDLGGDVPGREYVDHIRAGATDKPIRVEFVDKDMTTYLTMAAHPGTQVRLGDGPGATVMDRVPLAIVTRQGPSARFMAVLEPVAAGGRAGVTAVAAHDTPGGLGVTVRCGDRTDTFTLASDKALVVSRDATVVLRSP